MMLTLRGLPPDISTPSIRRLIQEKCSVKHVMLDELVMEEDGTQRIIIACMEQNDVGSIFKYFNGAKLGTYMLSVENYRDEQPLDFKRAYESYTEPHDVNNSGFPQSDENGTVSRKRTRTQLYQTNDEGSELFKRRAPFDKLQSASAELDGSFAGSPQMVPRPLMETAVPAPHMVTTRQAPSPELYEVAPFPQTGQPRFQMMQHKSMEQENQMPRPGGVGLGAPSQANSSGTMPPWMRSEAPALDQASVRRRPSDRSPREWDSGRRGVREERSRGRVDIHGPRIRLDPELHRADRSSSGRPRFGRPSSEQPRGDHTQRKRPLSPRTGSSRPSSKVARREPERRPSRVQLSSVIPTQRPTDRAPARVKSLMNTKSTKKQQFTDSDRPRAMTEAVFKVVQSTLGIHTKKNVSKPQFKSMYVALEEAIKIRLREILSTATVRDDDHLLNLYMEKYPRSTNEMLLRGVCTIINADPKLADELLASTSVNIESSMTASATIARQIIDPNITNKRLVPLDEKVLFTNLRQIIHERLKSMVEQEKFFTQNADLLVDFYRKKYNTSTDENLVSEALLREQTSNPNFKYRGKFLKQVKQQSAEASEPDKFILSNTPKGSKSDNLVPQNTTQASELCELDPQKSDHINTNKFTRWEKQKLPALGTSENIKTIVTKDDKKKSILKEYTARYIASNLFKDHHLTYFYKPHEITGQEKNVVITKLMGLILSSMKSLTSEMEGMVSAEAIFRIYRENYSESDDMELLETVAKQLKMVTKKEMEPVLPATGAKPVTPPSAPVLKATATENMKPNITKDDIKVSIWKEYTARSIASKLFKEHHLKYKALKVTGREKNMAIAKLKELILSSMDSITAEVEGMVSAEATLRIYREHYSESDDVELLETVAKEMKTIRQQMKTAPNLHMEWPVTKKAKKTPAVPVLKATDQKPQPTTPQELSKKPFKPMIAQAKEWANIITDMMVDKAMSSFEDDATVNSPKYLPMKERLTNIFHKRLYLLALSGQRKQRFPSSLDVLKQMYSSKYSESDDARMAANVKRIFEINKDASTIDQIPAALNTESNIMIIKNDDNVKFTEDTSSDNFAVDNPIQNLMRPNDDFQEPGPAKTAIQQSQPLQGLIEKVGQEYLEDSLRDTDVTMVDVSDDAKMNDLNIDNVDMDDLEDY